MKLTICRCLSVDESRKALPGFKMSSALREKMRLKTGDDSFISVLPSDDIKIGNRTPKAIQTGARKNGLWFSWAKILH